MLQLSRVREVTPNFLQDVLSRHAVIIRPSEQIDPYAWAQGDAYPTSRRSPIMLYGRPSTLSDLTLEPMGDRHTLGLLRQADLVEQGNIVSKLSLALGDLYDSIDTAREDAEELEDSLNEILYGVRPDRGADRIARCAFLARRGF